MSATRAVRERQIRRDQRPATAWLVERGQPEGQDPPEYLSRTVIGLTWFDSWTADPWEADWFDSRELAQAVIRRRQPRLFARAVEHGFTVDQPLAFSAAGYVEQPTQNHVADPLQLPETSGDYQRGYVAGWDDGHDCTAGHEHGPTALLYLLLVSVLVAGALAGFLAAKAFAATPRPATQVELARSFPGWRTGAPPLTSDAGTRRLGDDVAVIPPAATSEPLVLVTRTGILSHMGPGWPADYLALPVGPGHKVRLCAARCGIYVSTDAGPSKAMLDAGRIADASVEIFEHVCQVPRSWGLCNASWTVVP